MKNNEKSWCSLQEAAEILGVSYPTVRRRVLSGVLEAKKEGRWYFVKCSDVEKLAEQTKIDEKSDENQMIIALETELKLIKEQNQILKEQNGFLFEQIREKDELIKKLTPLALPKPKVALGERLKRIFKRSKVNSVTA